MKGNYQAVTRVGKANETPTSRRRLYGFMALG